MLRLMYLLGISLYTLLIMIAARFNTKAKLFYEGRKSLWQTLTSYFSNNTAPTAWFHCASLGEFEQARPVIESFRSTFPHFKILLTFFSPSGYEPKKNYPHADIITYLPLDTPQNAQRFIEITKPQLAIFIKYEFWPFFLMNLKEKGIPVYSVSAIFRKNQLHFKPYGAFFRKALESFSHLFVQDESSLTLLKQIGIHQASIIGDTRFDRVYEIVQQAQAIPLAEKFKDEKDTLVIGSSWQEDLEVIHGALKHFDKLKVIIAPHEINESNLQRIEKLFAEKKIVRFSQVTINNVTQFEVLIIDNIGMLSALYKYGDFAYIGGAFGKGLHNILEAATYGIPVIFGEKYDKFREARELVEKKGAFSIKDTDTFYKLFIQLYKDKNYREKTGKICQNYVKDNIGATSTVIQFLNTPSLKV